MEIMRLSVTVRESEGQFVIRMAEHYPGSEIKNQKIAYLVAEARSSKREDVASIVSKISGYMSDNYKDMQKNVMRVPHMHYKDVLAWERGVSKEWADHGIDAIVEVTTSGHLIRLYTSAGSLEFSAKTISTGSIELPAIELACAGLHAAVLGTERDCAERPGVLPCERLSIELMVEDFGSEHPLIEIRNRNTGAVFCRQFVRVARRNAWDLSATVAQIVMSNIASLVYYSDNSDIRHNFGGTMWMDRVISSRLSTDAHALIEISPTEFEVSSYTASGLQNKQSRFTSDTRGVGFDAVMSAFAALSTQLYELNRAETEMIRVRADMSISVGGAASWSVADDMSDHKEVRLGNMGMNSQDVQLWQVVCTMGEFLADRKNSFAHKLAYDGSNAIEICDRSDSIIDKWANDVGEFSDPRRGQTEIRSLVEMTAGKVRIAIATTAGVVCKEYLTPVRDEVTKETIELAFGCLSSALLRMK